MESLAICQTRRLRSKTFSDNDNTPTDSHLLPRHGGGDEDKEMSLEKPDIEEADWNSLEKGRLIEVALHREVSGQCPKCGSHKSTRAAIIPGPIFIKCWCGQLYEVRVSKKKWGGWCRDGY